MPILLFDLKNRLKLESYYKKQSKGKKAIFESMGYPINDSDKLKGDYERVALEKYKNGQYELGVLDNNGQRINISIELKGKVFKAGWMVEPNGKIRNTTPFGGWL